jgi:kynurenine formamidase
MTQSVFETTTTALREKSNLTALSFSHQRLQYELTLHYPGFGADAVSWLIEQRSIGALGIDTMGIDPGADASCGANRLLLREHRIHLENLAGLGEMPPSGGWIIVGGIRIRGGSGSPATVFGLIP